jgi:Rrf2 family protein
MNVTSKSRYAFKVMIALAQAQPGTRLQRQSIAQREGVPANFLDQIVLRLQRSGLIKCWRGRAGGLSLVRSPADITALEIIESVEDDPAPVSCLEHAAACELAFTCNSRDAWKLVSDRMRSALHGVTLVEMSAIATPKPHAARGVMANPPAGGPQACGSKPSINASTGV